MAKFVVFVYLWFRTMGCHRD